MKEFVRLRAKTYSYLTDNNENKKSEGTEKCVIWIKLKFDQYKDCLEATQIENERNYL